MKKYCLFVSMLCLLLTASCNQSRLNEKGTKTTATIAVFLSGDKAQDVSAAMIEEILPVLSSAVHLERGGSPSPQIGYVLWVYQGGVSEDFYFFNDCTPASFRVSERGSVTVTRWMKRLVETKGMSDELLESKT